MTATQPTAEDEMWRTRGREDAPVALRAITRLVLDHASRPAGYTRAYAIFEAYGQDLEIVTPGVATVRASESRLRLLSALISDANREEWMRVWPGGGDFMHQYRIGFLGALDSEMASWFAKPTHPPEAPDIVAEESKWNLALMMGELVPGNPVGDALISKWLTPNAIPKPRRGWRRFLHPM
jgi:hypothetical protein